MPVVPDILTGLPPILDVEVETLILGSFPSPASLAACHYYAHPQNQFWRIMAALTGEPDVLDPATSSIYTGAQVYEGIFSKLKDLF